MTTIMTTLIEDIENIMDYLTLAKNNIILTRLLPFETIIVELP